MQTTDPWLVTTPEGIVRAGNVLKAFRSGDLQDVGQIIAADIEASTLGETFAALVVLGSNIAGVACAYGGGTDHAAVIDQTTQIVLAAIYGTDSA